MSFGDDTKAGTCKALLDFELDGRKPPTPSSFLKPHFLHHAEDVRFGQWLGRLRNQCLGGIAEFAQGHGPHDIGGQPQDTEGEGKQLLPRQGGTRAFCLSISCGAQGFADALRLASSELKVTRSSSATVWVQ